jgi:hypothetical protein
MNIKIDTSIKILIFWALASVVIARANECERFKGVPNEALKLVDNFMQRVIIDRGGGMARIYFVSHTEKSLSAGEHEALVEAKSDFERDSFAIMNMLPQEGNDTIVLINATTVPVIDRPDTYYLHLVYRYGAEGRMFELKTPTIVKQKERVILGQIFNLAFASKFQALISLVDE